MGFTDGNSLVCCCQETGDLVTFDLRENFTKIKDEHTNTLNNTTARECYWTSTVKESSLVTMSSSGHIQKLDPKDLSKAVSHVVTGLATTSDLRYLTINVSIQIKSNHYRHIYFHVYISHPKKMFEFNFFEYCWIIKNKNVFNFYAPAFKMMGKYNVTLSYSISALHSSLLEIPS